MSEPRKNHLNIDGGQVKEDEHVSTYKPIPESDTDFRSSKASIHKSKEKVSADGAEEKLLDKEEEAKIVTRVDMADAKYVVGDHRNGDAKIELDAGKKQFSGLTKEELMKYAEDPFWVRLRWFMFVLFWALWLCMLAGAIAIIIRAPKCALPTPRTWPEKGPLVDMSSLEGYNDIEPHLPLLKKSHVAGIFTKACKDSYEVLEDKSDCIEQFKEFIVKAKNHGIKVIVDLTANYVSESHKWFQLSANRSAQYENYFIWAKSDEYEDDPTDSTDPTDSSAATPTRSNKPKRINEWVSKMNEPAWSWNEKRGEYYLHHFDEKQPDLNFSNPEVVKRFDAVIKSWMDAGADGIRLHNARELLVNISKTEMVQDPKNLGADHTQYKFWKNVGTKDQPQLDGLLQHWSYLAQGSDATVFTISENKDEPELFLQERNTSALRPPSTQPLRVLAAADAARDIAKRLPRWPLMQLEAEGAADDTAQAELAIFSMLLPAAPVLTPQQLAERDDVDASASFSHAADLRQDHVVEYGQHALAAVPACDLDASHLLACIRWKVGHLSYAAVYNPGAELSRANLTAMSEQGVLPPTMAVHHVSPAVHHLTNYTKNAVVNIDDVMVPSKATVVLSFAQKTPVET